MILEYIVHGVARQRILYIRYDTLCRIVGNVFHLSVNHPSNPIDEFSNQDKISNPKKILPCAREVRLGNPSSTREHESTASSNTPAEKMGWGLDYFSYFTSRLRLPQAMLRVQGPYLRGKE